MKMKAEQVKEILDEAVKRLPFEGISRLLKNLLINKMEFLLEMNIRDGPLSLGLA